MIRDTQVLRDIRDEWETVRAAQNMVAGNIAFSFVGGGITSDEFRNLSYSLCLLFAFSVLEHALLQFRNEKIFRCDSNFVGPLMKASKQRLNWVDYKLVEEAYGRRNDIAHRRIWIEHEDCFRYLDAVEAQLREWGIIM